MAITNPAEEKQNEKATLKDPSTWPDDPIFFCAAPSKDNDDNDEDNDVYDQDKEKNEPSALPLGEPIPFDTDLFKGTILFRIRGIPSTSSMDDEKDGEDSPENKEYFKGKKRKYQVVIQGQFLKRDMKFSNVYFGAKYNKPFTGIPLRGTGLLKKLQNFIAKLNPGMLYDIVADQPRVMAPIGTCQKLSIDKPGKEPNILKCHQDHGIQENTKLLVPTSSSDGNGKKEKSKSDGNHYFKSRQERRKKLSKPKFASQFVLDPDLVYTFEIYDHTVDFKNYQQHYGGIFFKVDLSNKLNGQPLAFSALHKISKDEKEHSSKEISKKNEEEIVYDFQVWHKKLIKSL